MKLSDFYNKNGGLKGYAVIKDPKCGLYDVIKLNRVLSCTDKKHALEAVKHRQKWDDIEFNAENLKQNYIEKRSK